MLGHNSIREFELAVYQRAQDGSLQNSKGNFSFMDGIGHIHYHDIESDRPTCSKVFPDSDREVTPDDVAFVFQGVFSCGIVGNNNVGPFGSIFRAASLEPHLGLRVVIGGEGTFHLGGLTSKRCGGRKFESAGYWLKKEGPTISIVTEPAVAFPK